MVTQSIRFDRDLWSKADAERWVEKHERKMKKYPKGLHGPDTADVPVSLYFGAAATLGLAIAYAMRGR